MTTRRRQTFVTPMQRGRTLELANGGNGLPVLRKKLLPIGRIRHPDTGEWVTFDHSYHQSLIDAFDAGAVEQTPLQLANDRNQHNMSPELTRAHALRLSHMEPGDTDGPGLYGEFQPHSRKAWKLIRNNPGLGVSCQVEEGRTRVDGKTFPRLLRHVLATLDPRVVGLGQWRTVSLSDDEMGSVVDLTNAKIKEIPVGKGGKSGALAVSEAEAEAAVDSVLSTLSLSYPHGGTDRAAQLAALGKGKGKGKGKKGKKGKAGKRGVALANTDSHTLNLAVDLDEQRREMGAVQAELAESRWEQQKATLYRGVPKAILDLAEPVLASPTAAILSLANGDGDFEDVDASKVIRDILAVVPRLDLSEELPGEGAEPGAGDDPALALDDAWDARSGKADEF